MITINYPLEIIKLVEATYDIFISHSSKDNNDVVRPLVAALQEKGLSVWYDEDAVKLGDSIKESVISGLSQSQCAVIVITENFISSNWTWLESGYMLSKNVRRPLIPILHRISHDTISTKMPFIADLKFITTDIGFDDISNQIYEVVTECKSISSAKESHTHRLISYLRFVPAEERVAITTEINDYKSIKQLDPRLGLVKAKYVVDYLVKSLWKIKFGLDSEMPSLSCNNAEDVVNLIGPANLNTLEHLKLIQRISADAAKGNAVDKDMIELVEESLFRVVLWMCEVGNDLRKDRKKSPLLVKIYPGDFSKDDIIETFKIEKKILRPDLISHWEEVYKWYTYNNYTSLGVRDLDSNSVVAFANLIPVTEEFAGLLRSGTITDVEIPLKYIRQYNIPDFYTVYIASICVDPAYQNTNAFLLLYNFIIKTLLDLAKYREVYVQTIIAEASTEDGEKLCRFIDMKQVTVTQHDTKIYETTLIPPKLRLRSKFGNELLNFCRKKYVEFRDLL